MNGIPTESRSSDPTNPRPASRGLLLVPTLVFLATFGPLLLGVRSLFARDFLSFGYPIAVHLREALRHGQWPLWNPLSLSGHPFLAQWNTQVLYPPAWLLMLTPMPWGLNIFNLGHLALGAWGVHRLCTRLQLIPLARVVATAGFAFSGLLLSSLCWPNNIAALGWAPWVLAAGCLTTHPKPTRHRCPPLATLVAIGSLQFLAGAPEIIGLTWLLLPVLNLPPSRRDQARFLAQWLGAIAGVLLLTAAQWLPFLELLRESHRGTAAFSNETAWSLAPQGWINLLTPLAHTVRDRDGVYFQPGQQWLISPYPGIGVVLLGLLTLHLPNTAHPSPQGNPRRLWITAGLSLWVAVGPAGGLYTWIRYLIPAAGMIRYPVKAAIPALLCLPLLAAWGLHQFILTPLPTARRHLRITAGILTILLIGTAILCGRFPATGESIPITLADLATRVVIVTLVAWIMIRLHPGSKTSDHPWLAPAALVMVLSIDLVQGLGHANPVAAPAFLTPGHNTDQVNSPPLEPVPRPGSARVHVSPDAHLLLDRSLMNTPEAAAQIPRLALILNLNLLEGIPKTDGFFSLYLARYRELLARDHTLPDSDRHGLREFLAISHTSRPRQPWVWDPHPLAAGWFHLVSRAEPSTNTLTAVLSSHFDPASFAIVDLEDRAAVSSLDATATGSVALDRFSPQEVVLHTESTGTQLLTMAQCDAPGWLAWIDGQPAPHLRVNHAFQGVVVPAGKHAVVFTYSPASTRIGLTLSLVGILLLTGWIATRRIRKGEEVLLPVNRLDSGT